MPGSSLGTRASSMRPPPGATTSGTAFESPPAPTSWMIRTGFASPIAQQASITCCARRCISGLPRCTDAKSSDSLPEPLPCDEAAPPPRPISIAGPPSSTSGAPAGTGRLSTCACRTLPTPPAIMIGL